MLNNAVFPLCVWKCFCSHKRQVHSRAYINFKKPEDVIDFYEVFNGHIFVNEKGAQYKALVEYAPHQRVPKPRSKKDVREGTITKGKVQMEPWFLFSDMLGFSLIFRDLVRGVNPGKCPVCKKS
jgi:hypothetical protein